MKLRLINFRCYDDKIFDLGKDGLSLISGSSGLGKSTIFMAIYFALYGTGTKIISHGKTNCTVEMEFDDMKIVRTKRPNRVVVNDIYEDDAAQKMINAKFGDCFNVTGYIAQNAIGSFVLMSPIEKLEFLEKFAFKDVDLGKIKGKCKAHITKKHEHLISVTSQLDMAQKILAEQKVPEEVKFPLKYAKSLYDKATRDQEIRLKNATNHSKRCIKRIKTLNQELNALNILLATTRAKDEILSSMVTKLNRLQNEKQNIQVHFKGEIESHKFRLKSLIEYRKFSALKESYKNDLDRLKEMKQNESEKIQSEITQIQNDLWADFSVEEHTDALKESEQFARDFELLQKLRLDRKKYENVSRDDLEEARMRLDKLREEYRVINNLIEMLKIQEEVYTCPCCQNKLRLKDKELRVFENTINVNTDIQTISKQKEVKEQEIQKLERYISELDIKIHRYDEITHSINEITEQYSTVDENITEIKNDIAFLREYKNTQLRNEKRLEALKTDLQNENFSASYISFKNNVFEKEKELNSLQITAIENETMSEDELRDKIILMEANMSKHTNVCNHIAQLQTEISTCEHELETLRQDYITKFEQIRESQTIEQSIKQQEEEQKEHEQSIIKFTDVLEQIKKYREYEAQRKTYDEWCARVKELNIQEQEARKTYESALILKEKILEAESKAILNIINSINLHTQIYLDCFFVDNPISITLMPFKETKKSTKPQINLSIEYKEMDCDLSMLSGGELSRVILAFTLALGEMFNTPILLLDEATASLDQELTGVVMRGIREHFSGKLVVTIAHQVVTGIFDRTISL